MITDGQGKTDENEMVLGHMAIIPLPVLFACQSVKKRQLRSKTKTKIYISVNNIYINILL